MALAHLIKASALSVVDMYLVCALGAWITYRGLVPKHTARMLGKLIYYVFLPCMLLAKLAKTVNSDVVRWWPLAVMPLVCATMGYALGRILTHIMRVHPKSALYRPAVFACTWGNAGPIPLAILANLRGHLAHLHADAGQAYVAVALIPFHLAFWSLGFTYLAGPAPPADGSHDLEHDREHGECINDGVPLLSTPARVHAMARRLFNAPNALSLLGVFIGAVRPLHGLFFGHNAPLDFVTSTVQSVGACTVPAALLLLGANMVTLVNTPRARQPPWRVVAGVCVCKMVLLPALVLGVVHGLVQAGVFSINATMQFVLLLLSCTPTALNMVTITQFTRGSAPETAALLLWEHVAALPLLTVWASVFSAVALQ